ncbi:Uncharacterised protein [Candidatus Burarchaeum australiense]|nr:Uncharacterised protein [Candidatus Burarchaeum australiense]
MDLTLAPQPKIAPLPSPTETFGPIQKTTTAKAVADIIKEFSMFFWNPKGLWDKVVSGMKMKAEAPAMPATRVMARRAVPMRVQIAPEAPSLKAPVSAAPSAMAKAGEAVAATVGSLVLFFGALRGMLGNLLPKGKK